MNAEVLINQVRQYKVLYDMSCLEYTDNNRRNNCRIEAWKQISKQLNIPVDDCKNKWSKLRNCFTNAIKRRDKKANGKTASCHMNPWKYEKQMSFLLPFMQTKRYSTYMAMVRPNDESIVDTIKEEIIIDSTDSLQSLADTPSDAGSEPKQEDEPPAHENNTWPIMSSNEQRNQDFDGTDHFFMAMSNSIKKLPQGDQVRIKMELHKAIYEAELRQLEAHGDLR